MLPQQLREGYAAFRAGRLAAEQSRYRELAERGQIAPHDGNRLLQFPGRSGNDFRRRPG